MTEQQMHNRALLVLGQTVQMFRDVGVPDHAVPPAMADHLMMVTLAIGRGTGHSYEAARVIIERMQRMLEDFKQGRAPFGDFDSKPG